METNTFYMIPFISKELDALGYVKLPYTIEVNSAGEGTVNRNENYSDLSVIEKRVHFCSNKTHISFNSEEMISCLVSVCDELIKTIKLSNEQDTFCDTNNDLRFRNCNLQKEVNNLKRDLQESMKLVSELREKCRQLNINLSESNQKIKAVEKAKLKISKQSSLNEDLWKVKYRKIEEDLLKLEKLLYMEPFVHKCFHPANLKMPKSLKNLWTDIKCSSKNLKEVTLSKAVRAFGENNALLLEENSKLRTLLLVTIEEINFLFDFISEKVKIPLNKFDREELITILEYCSGLHSYKEYIWRNFNFFINVFNYFDEFSFNVGDDLFVCLSDMSEKIKNVAKK